MTVLGMLVPHARQADVRGFWALAAGTALTGTLLTRYADRIPLETYRVCMLLASCTVTLSLYFNGERLGAHAAGNQVLYVWIALYSGYFFSRAAMAVQLLTIGGLYAGVLLVVHPGPVALTRWLITVGMVSAAAIIVHHMKLRNDELLDRLAKAARTDSLTGLLNRQGFDEAIRRELALAGRTGRPTTLIIADIDRFKSINDRDGHAAGDAVLSLVGRTVQGIARGSDAAARVGGDEFAVILPDTDAESALQFAERVREAVLCSNPTNDEPISLSLGVAESSADGLTADTLIRSADKALYTAKELGRNQTVAAPGARMTIHTRSKRWRTRNDRTVGAIARAN